MNFREVLRRLGYLILFLLFAVHTAEAQTENEEFEHAHLILKMKKYRVALQEYTHILQKDSSSFIAWNNRSLCYLNLQKNDSALSDIGHALKLVPGAPESLLNKGLALEGLHRLKESLAVLTGIPQSSDVYEQALLVSGQCALDSANYPLARSFAKKVLLYDHTNGTGYALLAYAELREHPGNYERIIALLDTAMKYTPDEPQVIFWNSYYRLLMKDFRASESVSTRLINRTQEYGDIYFVRGMARIGMNDKQHACTDLEIACEMGSDSASEKLKVYCPDKARLISAYRKMRLIWVADSTKNLQEEGRLIAAVMQESPDYAVVHTINGEYLLQRGDTASAIAQFEESKKLDAFYPFSYSDMGTLKMIHNDMKGALEEIDIAIKLRSDNPDFFLLRANIYSHLGDPDAALKDIEKCTELKSPDWKVYGILSDIYFSKTQFSKGISCMDSVIHLNPEPNFYLLRAKALAQTGNFSRALNDADTYLTLAPEEKIKALHFKLDLLIAMNKQKEYILVMNQLIAETPADPLLYIKRGECFHAQKKHKEAIADFSKAIELDPTSGYAYYLRGTSKFGAGDYTGCCKDLGKATQLKYPGAALAYKQSCQ
jgi:tetratricopeptide (TPR) repeat protein